MKNNYVLFLIVLLNIYNTINGFIIPKFYHGRMISQENPRFSEENLTSCNVIVGGGTKNFCQRGYHGRLDVMEVITQFYQNMSEGFFFHAAIPFCWIKLNDLERINDSYEAVEHCIHKNAIYSPGVFVGWTINYEETTHLDFIDAMIEIGTLLPSPRNAISMPLFPIGYTEKPGFATLGACSLGALEWLTTGIYGQAIFFNPATIWSTGLYITFDHIIPKISFTGALCGDGQNKQIESIEPWHMLSVYVSGEVDLATDERPWLPRIGAFFTKPIAGKNIFKAGLGGFSIGIDAHIIF